MSTITWTAQGNGNGIPPGAFRDFGLSVQVPGKAGDKLTFKALQTYSTGEVVRWIGPAGSDNPAPVVTVDTATLSAPTPAPAKQTSNDSGSDTLSIIALIVGIAGLAAGGAALAMSPKRTGAHA